MWCQPVHMLTYPHISVFFYVSLQKHVASNGSRLVSITLCDSQRFISSYDLLLSAPAPSQGHEVGHFCWSRTFLRRVIMALKMPSSSVLLMLTRLPSIDSRIDPIQPCLSVCPRTSRKYPIMSVCTLLHHSHSI